MPVAKKSRPAGFVEILHRKVTTPPLTCFGDIRRDDYSLGIPAVRLSEFDEDDVFSIVRFYFDGSEMLGGVRGIQEFDIVTYFVPLPNNEYGVTMWLVVHHSKTPYFDNKTGQYVSALWTPNILAEMPKDRRFCPFSPRRPRS